MGRPDWGALYLLYRDVMHRVAAASLREAGLDAQVNDVVQEAMMSIMASPPTGEVKNWEALLVTVTKGRALDLIRSASVRHAGPELSDDHDHAVDTEIADDVAEAVDRSRRAGEAWDALSVLDERHRKVVWERAALGRSREEVAKDLGVSPARISQTLTHALEQLRDEMTERRERDGEI